jgi:endonuclease YncB( thermonuclease family)
MKTEAKEVKGRPGYLRKIGVPAVLIPGIVLAATLGWTGWKKLGPDYYANKVIFPDLGYAAEVYDGDTLLLRSGMTMRLLGINAPNRGEKGYEEAGKKLTELIKDRRLWFEYDRYQNDKFGRIMAWVWTGCETRPQFLPADYMYKSKRESMPGLKGNPAGCKKGKLVQEEMIGSGKATLVVYDDRGELKYQKRLED